LQRQSRLSIWCERLIEGGWLLAVVLIPSYFNLLSSRHFEPDKATTLRAIVLVMAAAAVIRFVDGLGARSSAPPPDATDARTGFWRRFAAFPMALPVALYVLVFLLATALSVVPYTSFWGSYQRLQGTYTNLSYVLLGTLVVLTARQRAQIERLVTLTVLGSLPAVGYGLVQHFQIDPLPWQGDVVSRVASTMGNSIFVAAYMIMVLPLALYLGVAALSEARAAPAAEQPRVVVGWTASYTLLVVAALALVYGAVQFGAVVRTADLRFWWVYPAALVVAGALFLLPTLRLHTSAKVGVAELLPALLLLTYVLVIGLSFAIGQAAGDLVVQPSPGRGGTEWPLWMGGAVVLAAIGYALLVFLPRLEPTPSRLFLRLQGAGGLLIAALLLVTIFFTQSRGPWIGGAFGLFVFGTLLLIQALRRARSTGDERAAARWRALLIGEVAFALALGAFLVAFNLSDAPFFQQLRGVPYVGRMGRLLEVDEGTGLVRRLIWTGDEKAGGAVALIASDPLRAVVGWGPESMFVAYNRFYPPALANIESRGASPDRSHQAYLDELINKGVLGLASYLFVLLSFFTLAWRLLRQSDDWRTQTLMVACIATVAAHAVEGLTGIPIVSTLMLLWLTLAIVVTTGGLMGAYALPGAAPPAPAAAPEVPAEPQAARPGGQRRRGQSGQRAGGVARGAAQRSAKQRSSGDRGIAGLAVYALVALLALAGAWSFNVDNVYADMRFQQGQGYTESQSAGFEAQIVGTSYYLDAIRQEPRQDFYYLSLGRSLMTIVALRAEALEPGADQGALDPNASVEALLRLQDPLAVQQFVLERSPLELMSYAKAVLERAQQINPLNKDHYANLGRMYNFWFQTLAAGQDPELMQQAVEWYRRGHEIAPQDVTILNEYASAVARTGDYQRAEQLLEQSRALDPRYPDTSVRLGEVLRLQGRYAEATDQYLALLEGDPHALDGQITTIAIGMRDAPEELLRLRDAYNAALAQQPDDARLLAIVGLLSDRAGDLPAAADAFGRIVAAQPDNLEARQNYTLVLSDMLAYERAAEQAEALRELAGRDQQLSDADRAALDGLVQLLRARAAGG
jgi:tetratricopeptide (TPR) repeat protein